MSPTVIASILFFLAVCLLAVCVLLFAVMAGYFLFGGRSAPAPEDDDLDASADETEEAPRSAPPVTSLPPPPGRELPDDEAPTVMAHDISAAMADDASTEMFSRDAHGRLMGWDDDDDEEEEGSGATELFSREDMAAQYADLLDDDDDDDDDDDEDDDLPGTVVA